MTTELSIFDRPATIPEDLRQAAHKKGWPDALLERALELRCSRGQITWWLTHDQPTLEQIQEHLNHRKALMLGTMRARQATWNDDEALADLYANSPEEIGDWEVTVHRSPNPFAQFRLQEHVSISVLEDRGIVLAATADSARNTLVGGKKTSAHIASAWRVRKEFRGQGLSRMLRMAEGPAVGWFGVMNYYYIRSGNFAALEWVKSFIPESINAPKREGDIPGISVTVHHFSPEGQAASLDPAIQLAKPSSVRRCLALINRSHRGADLFRPYSTDYLEQRLDDPFWGEKPEFWEPVYGWPDYYVLEEKGQVMACGGLWDKGKNVRETWRHKATGESKTLASTALMDFGYAAGREDAMARLISYFVALTRELGRDYLVAAIEHLPELEKQLEVFQPTTETRALHWQRYERDLDRWVMDAGLKRPYTDLAYW